MCWGRECNLSKDMNLQNFSCPADGSCRLRQKNADSEGSRRNSAHPPDRGNCLVFRSRGRQAPPDHSGQQGPAAQPTALHQALDFTDVRYIHIYIIYIYTYVHIHMFGYAYIHNIYIYICMYVCIHIQKCVYISVYICKYV